VLNFIMQLTSFILATVASSVLAIPAYEDGIFSLRTSTNWTAADIYSH
jgi:hypothetical protein